MPHVNHVAALIETYFAAYHHAKRNEKKYICIHIVAIVTEKGRFLQRCEDKGCSPMWSPVSYETALLKVAQALKYRRRLHIMSHGTTYSEHQDDTVGSSRDAEDNSDNITPEWLVANVLHPSSEIERQHLAIESAVFDWNIQDTQAPGRAPAFADDAWSSSASADMSCSSTADDAHLWELLNN
jgi:hypothetical protein